MTGWMLGCLVGTWAAVVVAAPPARSRLAALRLVGDLVGPGAGSQEVRVRNEGPAARPRTVVVLDLSVLALFLAAVPGATGLLLGASAVVVAHLWVSRLPTRARLADLAAARRELPLVLELVAAALRTGATTETAVLLAADAAGPGVAGVLREVVAGLRLGASAEEAWRPALALDGLDRLARAAMRSATSGAALRAACSDLARRERRLQHLEAQAAVRRAGVWAVLPLALCFLPAFVLLGVVPLVVGLLQSVAL